MIDLRIWRVLLFGVPLALVVAMFSLDDFPAGREAAIAPDAFEASTAESLSARLGSVAPGPRPGSESDRRISDIAESRFKAIQGAALAEQAFEASYEGETVDLRNVIAILPGASQRQVVVMAHRDSTSGDEPPSLAATAVLLEIASSFSGANHESTLVFVSTSGGSIGALGAKRFASDYTDIDLVDAIVVISDPASPGPRPPFVITSSTGPEDTSAQLERTAAEVVAREAGGAITGGDSPAEGEGGAEDEAEEPSSEELRDAVLDRGFMRELFSLALPAGFGGQAPLIGRELDAVRISSRGELPAPPGAATAVDALTLDRFGRSTLGLVLALDQAGASLEPGPPAHLDLAGNLLPGWALAVIAMAALLAPLVAALEAVGRLAARPEQAALAALWVIARALPFVAVLAVIWLLALVGVIGDPTFPFDPGAQSAGWPAWILALGLGALCVGGVAVLPRVTRPLIPPTDLAAPMAILAASLAIAVAWFWNPYLALVLAALPNAWIGAADPTAAAGRRAGFVALGFVPLLFAFADLARRFGESLGPGFAWDLLMLRTSGQLSTGTAALFCVVLGAAVALARPPRLIAAEPELRVSGPARPGEPEPPPAGAEDETTDAAAAPAVVAKGRSASRGLVALVAGWRERRARRRRRARVREARARAARRSIEQIRAASGEEGFEEQGPGGGRPEEGRREAD